MLRLASLELNSKLNGFLKNVRRIEILLRIAVRFRLGEFFAKNFPTISLKKTSHFEHMKSLHRRALQNLKSRLSRCRLENLLLARSFRLIRSFGIFKIRFNLGKRIRSKSRALAFPMKGKYGKGVSRKRNSAENRKNCF